MCKKSNFWVTCHRESKHIAVKKSPRHEEQTQITVTCTNPKPHNHQQHNNFTFKAQLRLTTPDPNSERTWPNHKVNEQPVFDKHPLTDAANFVFAKLRTAPLGTDSSTLCWQITIQRLQPGRRGASFDPVGPFQSSVTFSSLLLFFPDNKHSSDRQQQAGHRPCAILVRHTLLLLLRAS